MSMHKGIRRILRFMALFTTWVALAALAGCSHGYSYYRPGVSKFDHHDTGLQSRDLVDMTNKMAADIVKCAAIAQSRTKVIVVMGHIHNKTSTPWQNDEIYVARIRALLNQDANGIVAFVMPLAKVGKLQSKYLGGRSEQFNSRTGSSQRTTITPQYVLNGTFYDLPNAATTYYLCSFKLVDIETGEIVWENKYETRTLNLY